MVSASQRGDGSSSAWPRFVTAYALVISGIEERLKAAGLPELAWYDVLWALERAPRGRLRMHALADNTGERDAPAEPLVAQLVGVQSEERGSSASQNASGASGMAARSRSTWARTSAAITRTSGAIAADLR